MSQPKDYYAALGLDKEATETDIKKAYRKLAMTCHPDKNPDDPNAKEKFQAISEAYSILSDPEKKGRYDRGELDDEGAEFDMNDFMQVAQHFSPPPPALSPPPTKPLRRQCSATVLFFKWVASGARPLPPHRTGTLPSLSPRLR
jgi:curved DNA-binding protein CbpA